MRETLVPYIVSEGKWVHRDLEALLEQQEEELVLQVQQVLLEVLQVLLAKTEQQVLQGLQGLLEQEREA
jgi:hypothetical protein